MPLYDSGDLRGSPIGPALAAGFIWALLYVVIGRCFIAQGALSPDEAVHAHIAIALLNPGKVPRYWPTMPLMKDAYQGALKTYLLYWPMKVFGISSEVVRWTTLSIGAAAVFFSVLAASSLYGPFWASVLGCLIATDPALVLAGCYDSAPAIVSLALKMVGLWLLIRWWERGGNVRLFAAGLAFGLCLWDKSHFLWFIFAGISCMALLWRQELIARSSPWSVLSLAAGFCVGSAPFLIYNTVHPLATFLFFPRHGWDLVVFLKFLPLLLLKRGALFFGLFTGARSYMHVGGVPTTNLLPSSLLAPGQHNMHVASLPLLFLPGLAFLLEVLIAGVVIIRARRRDSWTLRGTRAWLWLTFLIFLAACLTPAPVKFFHFYVLYPFPQLALIAFLHVEFKGKVTPLFSDRWLGPLLAGSLMLQAVGLSLFHHYLYVTGGGSDYYRGGVDVARWLDDYAGTHANTPVLTEDYFLDVIGFYTQGRVEPATFHLEGSYGSGEPDLISHLTALGATGGVVVVHLAEFAMFDSSGFVKLVQAMGLSISPLHIFDYSNGRPWVGVYRVESVGGHLGLSR
jgi:hypothetical protein